MAKVKCIYGAPCSGKSTYVKENAGKNDIVWDFDDIRSMVTLSDKHNTDSTDAQNTIIKQMRYSFAKNASKNESDQAWFIVTNPTDKVRELLGEDAEYIEMEVSEQECLDRLEKDDSRKDKNLFKSLIHDYFEKKEEKSKVLIKEKKMSTKSMETRTFLGAVESRERDNGDIQIAGMPVVFNQATDIGGFWEETIAADSIDEKTLRDVRLLVNHDMSGIPLARSRRNTSNSTMRLSIEKNGIEMVADLDQKNPKAIELNSAIERGDISGMSFAFLVDRDEWEDLDSDYPKRTITHIAEIYEVSAVTWPAYEQTSISSRSLESGQKSLADARAALESARQKSKKIADLNQRLKEINHD